MANLVNNDHAAASRKAFITNTSAAVDKHGVNHAEIKRHRADFAHWTKRNLRFNWLHQTINTEVGMFEKAGWL